MTVAAIVLADTLADALTDADNLSRVRRIADAAWSGGALPIVVVAPPGNGQVAAALAGAPVTLVERGPGEERPSTWLQRGADMAAELVAGTTAVLIWPSAMCWVGPETVTSLIEAHGARPDALLQPSYGGTAGWPKLLPLGRAAIASALARLLDDPATGLPDLGRQDANPEATMLALELGDPGVIVDGSTARVDLPPYDGPPQPVHDHGHEWGAALDVLDERDEPVDPDADPAADPRLTRG